MLDRDDKSERGAAFAVFGKNVVTARDKTTCAHYGKFSHDETGCFDLIRYPPRLSSQRRSRGACGSRGGHRGRAGSSEGRGGGREIAHVAVTASTTSNLTMVLTNPVKVNILGPTADQTQQLMSFLDTPKNGVKKLIGNVNWMLDSGASMHMTGNEKMLKKLQSSRAT